MGFRAVCIESRCRCSYSGGYLVVTGEAETTKIHLSEIASLTFCTTKVYVSGYLMSELAKNKIPVVFTDEKSYPVAESLPLFGSHNCPKRLDEQLAWSVPAKKRLWQKVVRDKIKAQSEVLTKWNFDREATILLQFAEDVRSGDPTNREAAAAGMYFSTLFGKTFNRDQDSDLNACLNYGYSILLSKVSREIVSRGYLTQTGINHRSELNQWNFSCDLMEPFRPFVDQTVLLSGIGTFDKEMRRLLIDITNRTVAYRDGSYKMGSVIGLYIQDCIDSLNRKISAEDIDMYEMP